MLVPPGDPPLVKKVLDAVVLMFLALVVLGLAWLCTRAGETLKPEEMDCLADLKAAARRDANYTEQDVVRYGRCLIDQLGQR